MTLGEYRVGITFNPSNNALVDQIKQQSARLIDLCETMKSGSDTEKIRLIALAQTNFEDAAMWAVKAATKTPVKPPLDE
jgi:hypothetical protein